MLITRESITFDQNEPLQVLLVEASDPKPVFELVTEWQEFMTIEATPVLEDDDSGAVLGKLFG